MHRSTFQRFRSRWIRKRRKDSWECVINSPSFHFFLLSAKLKDAVEVEKERDQTIKLES